MFKFVTRIAAALALVGYGLAANGATYQVDPTHSFITLKVKHLGYSWLNARFNDIEGQFDYDESAPEKSTVQINVDTNSFDSNHAQRDKHIHSSDFLDTDQYPVARFKSVSFTPIAGSDKATLVGDLTVFGKTQQVSLEVSPIGGGADPWGGERQGFEGQFTLDPADYGMDFSKKLGPSASNVVITVDIEGVKDDA